MFDSVAELTNKIRLGEDSTIEFKSVRCKGDKIVGPKRDDLADELAAMANTADAVCVLGIDDKTRAVEGIPSARLDDVERLIFELCRDSVKPPLTVKIVRLEIPNSSGHDRIVIKVDVPRSIFVHKSPGGYLQRIGSSRRELTPESLARLFQLRSLAGVLRFEELPVPDTSFHDLDQALWKRFVAGHLENPELTLAKLKLLTADEAGIRRATVAGVLMCTENPERWLANAVVECVRYRGTEQDSNRQTDASTIAGPLTSQIDEAMAFVRRNMTVGATKEPMRVEIPQYRERAVFEAIVNAVAHRDYSVYASKIRLFMFGDRLELYSPGALPNTVTIDSLPLRQATRNELITTLLARCPVKMGERVERGYYMEKRGDGVPIILKESMNHSGKAPTYRLIDEAELLLTIYSAPLPNQN